MKALYKLAMAAVLAACTIQLSCSINDYCINCLTDDGGTGSGGDGDGGTDGDGGLNDGGGVDAMCVPTGSEICDGLDNDCNGLVDDGVLPGVGELCPNQMGECAGGMRVCNAGVLECSKQPSPEVCDGLDNNCNGMVDEGNPGGGGKCGTELGECVAGTFECVAGKIECVGFIDHTSDPELCDGKDNDCDGNFDEGIGSLGTCGPTSTLGICKAGMLMCQGGGTVCVGAVFPSPEVCNDLDDNCDGNIDEIFDKSTDPMNCVTCGNVCPAASRTCINSTNASATCTSNADCPGGTCAVNSQPSCNNGCTISCNVGFHDLDHVASNGCEYHCFPTGNEECDGVDNDCDGKVDEDLIPPPICLSGGECGAVAPTATCTGMGGWTCTYTGAVEFPETTCDDLDNDCDGNVDENQPNKGEACDDGGVGACRGTGVYTCNANDPTGPAVCVITDPGQATPDPQETCDNIDNDCDGKVDEGSETGNLIGQEWVSFGPYEIMKYEASRFDATDSQQGTRTGTIVAPLAASPSGATQSGSTATFTTVTPHGLSPGTKVRVSGVGVGGYNGLWTVATTPTATTFTATLPSTGLAASGGGNIMRYTGACSKPGARPWTNVTYPEALAVCESMGATLCPETRWHQACSVVAPRTFPIQISNGTSSGSGTLIEAEDFYRNVHGASHAWIEDYTPSPNAHSGIANMRAMINNGTAVSLSNALANSPYLEYRINIPSSQNNWRVYVRMFSATSNDNSVHYGVSTSPTPVAPTGTISTSSNGVWQWRSSSNLNLAAGEHYLRLFMAEDGVKVDAIYIRRSTTSSFPNPQSPGGTWSYATAPTMYQPMTCNGADHSPTNDDILPTGSLASCYANHPAGGVFDMSGNVKEWTLARLPGENPIRGGASNDLATGISCALNFTLADDAFYFPNVGFRCCR